MATGRSLPEFGHEPGKLPLGDAFVQPRAGVADTSAANDTRIEHEREIFVQPPPKSVRPVNS